MGGPGRLATVPRDVWVGAVMLAVAVLYWMAAAAIPTSPLEGTVGADGLPKGLGVALGALAVLLILRSLAMRLAVGPDEPRSAEEVRRARHAHLRALGMLALGVAYLLVVPYLGYLLSIILLMGGVAAYNGISPSPRLAAMAAAGAVLFYLLFVQLLGIPLPPGLWPDLLARLTG